MMTRYITTIALVGGIVLGAAATEGFNVYRQSRDGQIFQERVHCKAVADAYVKANSTDVQANPTDPNFASVTLDKVDYSPARNSCVAQVETVEFFRGGSTERESVEDLLSGETLFSVSASQIGSGRTAKRTGLDLDAVRVTLLPRVWDYVLINADEPVALGKEYIQMESDLAQKATAPASSVAEPNDWQTVPATEYDAQGRPIASPQSPRTGKQDFYPDTGKPIQAPGPKK